MHPEYESAPRQPATRKQVDQVMRQSQPIGKEYFGRSNPFGSFEQHWPLV